MTVLIGIILLHMLVILRAKYSERGKFPYISVFFITTLLVAFVTFMLFTMAPPEL